MKCHIGLRTGKLWHLYANPGMIMEGSNVYLVTRSFIGSKRHTKLKDKRKTLNGPAKQRWNLRACICFKWTQST